MRRILPLLYCAAMMAAACLAATPELKQVKRVYFLQMTGGIDQYFAQHLINSNTIEVVTDPALADAIFSDRIGESFEQKLTELYPPPPPSAKEEDEEEPSKKISVASGATRGQSTWGRGRGNIYLIDRKSRAVVWSAFNKPKNSTAKELDRTAAKFASRLRADLKTGTLSVTR